MHESPFDRLGFFAVTKNRVESFGFRARRREPSFLSSVAESKEITTTAGADDVIGRCEVAFGVRGAIGDGDVDLRAEGIGHGVERLDEREVSGAHQITPCVASTRLSASLSRTS
ncbi:MAG TPA: hypothetical protein VGH87_13215 [Polyangiaceae bacterium]